MAVQEVEEVEVVVVMETHGIVSSIGWIPYRL